MNSSYRRVETTGHCALWPSYKTGDHNTTGEQKKVTLVYNL